MAELLHIDGAGTDNYGTTWVGNSITPDADWLVDSVWFDNIFTVSGTNDCTCYIYASAAGVPTGSALYTSQTSSIIILPGQATTFTFSSPAALSSGVLYWFVYNTAGGEQTQFYRTTTDIYAGGNIGFSGTSPTVGWGENATFDTRQFKINGTLAGSGLSSGQKSFTTLMGMTRRRR